MPERAEVEAKIAQRLAEDPGLRSRLKADPRGTLAAEFKIVLAPTVSVALHEDTAQELHIIVPPAPERPTTAPPVGDDRGPQNRAYQ
ncbi:MAG TPA: hypothetical protein VD978_15460 [Azospirillum sp.]|nr:hypothetical protein [Azospirillum sp.]